MEQPNQSLENKEYHDKLFEIILEKDEISWQSIIHDLIKSEKMDPWDINISLLTQRYIAIIKKLKELDLRLSGKVLLAAAVLLKMKSNRLVGEDLTQLDRLFNQSEEDFEDAFEDLESGAYPEQEAGRLLLIPRTPQPRRRKVSVYDLINALEKALEVKQRRVLRDIPVTNLKPPEKKKDISLIIKETFFKIKSFFFRAKQERLMFSRLVSSDKKEDKVYMFIPLLHLSNKGKIGLNQERHFSDFEVMLKTNNEAENETKS